eukprot:TRINITY_DN2127_c0_g1_i4.p1 TRINITY_DN2127_c0_g1~~TRINITY_DN2127_c0_g1_i4.p1  ORF type:complete len:635 (-),score=123.38 TRINITY_DN2127_c0_g1_i4:110-2014(-)
MLYRFINRHWVDWSDVIRDRYPASRSAHGSCVYQNWLYVFAGYDGTTRLNDMWRINISVHTAVQWECVRQIGESPPTCCNFPMTTIKDNMYVFSGQSGAKITNNLYQFSFPEQTWTKIQTEYLLRFGPYPPQRRYGHTMVAHGDSLYVFGGSADGTLPNELHKFDVESSSWEKIDPAPGSQIPNGRLFHSAAIQGNRMYVFGGMIDSSPIRLSDLFSFHIANYPKCTLNDDFANLLKKEEFCDLKFIVGKHGEVVWAHVAIVAARSPYLRKHLLSSGNFTKPGPDGIQSHEISTLTLSDQDPEAFKIALHFLYTDHILWPRSATDDTTSRVRNLKCMLELTKLAIILETQKLEKLCIHYIENAVCVDNVLTLLISAHELYLNQLKEYCIKFVVRDGHYQQVVMLPEFDFLESGLMVEIVRKQLKQSRGQQMQDQFTSDYSYNPSALTPQFYPSLESDLKAFLKDLGLQFADILLQIGSNSFPAHKCILAARCKYFEAMFRSFMPTDSKVNITFGQIVPSCQSFKALLNFIYYADIKLLPEDSLYIFQAPNFFGFSNSRIQVFCKEALEQRIVHENVINLLRISSEIGVEVVKKYTLNRIVANFNNVFDMVDFQDLSKDLLLDVLEALAKNSSNN